MNKNERVLCIVTSMSSIFILQLRFVFFFCAFEAAQESETNKGFCTNKTKKRKRKEKFRCIRETSHCDKKSTQNIFEITVFAHKIC